MSNLELKKWLNNTLLSSALLIRAMILLSPVMLLFYNEHGLGVCELFFFQGIFYLTSIIVELPIGYIADILSKKIVLIISFVFFLIAMSLWYFFHGYWFILLGEMLTAISKVAMDIAISGYLYEYLLSINCEKEMPKFLGIVNFCLAAGTAIVGIIGTYLYSRYGSSAVLLLELRLIVLGIVLLLFLKNIPAVKRFSSYKISMHRKFLGSVVKILRSENIVGYMLYSGLLTSFSILFALSFQPLMQLAHFPIILYGVVLFINHGIRALSSVLAGVFSFSIYTIRRPLYVLYIVCFIVIFVLNFSKNIVLNFILITLISLIIGFQLIFTILHISRLHKIIKSSCRGMSMSINNIIPKCLSVIILISSHFFMNNTGLWKFFLYYFVFFIFAGAVLLNKTESITE